MKILVTGCAGFIGYHLCCKLLNSKKKFEVLGVDNINSYYDINLKKLRLKKLKEISNKQFVFKKIDICDKKKLLQVFKKNKFDFVVNLAAQAGVRYSIEKPEKYFESNMLGFFNILDLSRIYSIKHFIFASTSSVYGDNKNFPLKEQYNTDNPISFYAATKKSNEILAYSYSYIYKLPITGLRFFTVYGPMGRPDMALFKFTKSMLEYKKFDVYNFGKHIRDFTYVDDVVESIYRLIINKPSGKIPYDIYNIGSNSPKPLMQFINIIKDYLSIKPKIKFKKLQVGDIYKTHASIDKLYKKINYLPKTDLKLGIHKFLNWYKSQYRKNNNE